MVDKTATQDEVDSAFDVYFVGHCSIGDRIKHMKCVGKTDKFVTVLETQFYLGEAQKLPVKVRKAITSGDGQFFFSKSGAVKSVLRSLTTQRQLIDSKRVELDSKIAHYAAMLGLIED